MRGKIKPYPMKMKPAYQLKPWGGRLMQDVLHKEIPAGLVGEAWEVSTHAGGMSRVANGPLKGLTLGALVETSAEELLGNVLAAKYGGSFPLLVKLIDVNQRASVQVHPDDVQAMELEGYPSGKSEGWYIIDAKPGHKIFVGFKDGVGRAEFLAALKEARLASILNQIEVVPGDCVYVPPGTVHACGDGVFMLEIQQSCDITYRVYDWDRVDRNGAKRELHIDKALKVINFKNRLQVFRAKGSPNALSDVLRSPYFEIQEVVVAGQFHLPAAETCRTGTLIEGDCVLEHQDGSLPLKRGDSFIVPQGWPVAIAAPSCKIVTTLLK
ncbi:MAG: class I mannose-6-phosphate isomerase [Kiritimatiellaeota bacterium]|nr:class I mannose-6-phosphate isomerase [Kiritimatiellota bacterium]